MSDYDGIKLCENCGEYTTGRLCTSCAWQEMIDNSPEPEGGGLMSPGWRDENGGYHDGELDVTFDEPPLDEEDTVKLTPIKEEKP